MVPYSLDCNDHRFLCKGSGWSSSDDFLWHMKETFDYLYQEGVEGRPKMMTIGYVDSAIPGVSPDANE